VAAAEVAADPVRVADLGTHLEATSQQVKDRLRRVEGQIRGIHKMVDEGRPCVDIVTQLLAARAALDRVAEQIITTHVDECLTTMEPDQAKTAVGKAIRMLARIET
jgi:DNA-binding FrmR family transcriptional regulator